MEHLLPLEEPGGFNAVDEAVGIVREILELAPQLSILCTSRRRLGLRGERLLEIGPLPTSEADPAAGPQLDLGALMESPSVRLYLDRAQSVRPDFTLTESNAPAVAALCRQLEGSPLALELAAAWVRALPPRKMYERLIQGQEIPAGGYSDLPARHRSLNAALEWSYRLLTPNLQMFFARLAVFRSSWTLESAAAIVCDGDEFLALTQLEALRNASLVRSTEPPGSEEIRYGLLESVRAYACQRLAESGDLAAAQRRHAACFLDLALKAKSEMQGPHQTRWLAALEAEHDNLRAAITFWMTGSRLEDAATVFEMIGALSEFWIIRGYWHEGRSWSEEALARTADRADLSAARAGVINGLASFAQMLGQYDRVRALYEESLAIYRDLNDQKHLGVVLHGLGYAALHQGEFTLARQRYEESLQIARDRGALREIGMELHHLGWVAHEEGDLARARPLYEESLTVRRKAGDLRGIAFTLNNLANLLSQLGKVETSRSLLEETLQTWLELGDRQGIALSYHNLGGLDSQMGDHTRAREMNIRAVEIYREIDSSPGIANCLFTFGVIEIRKQRYTRGIQLCAASEALYAQMGATPASEDTSRNQTLTMIRETVDAETIERFWAAGQRMSASEAISFALADD
jgi:predicted ATPase